MSNDMRYNQNSRPADIDSQIEKIDITTILDDMFKELLRLWWLMIIIISVTSTIFYFQRKVTYKAKYEASITFTVNADSPYEYQDNYYDQTAAKNLGTTMEYLLKSSSMKKIVAEDMKLKKVPGSIKVTCMESTNMITITCSSRDPDAAYNMLQSVLRNYETVCESVIGSTTLTEMDQSGVPTVPANSENCMAAAKNGLALGLVIDLALLCLLAITKRTIRKEEDFEKIFNIECYGAIPSVHFKKRGKSMDEAADAVLIDNYRIPGGFLESIRSVRTRVERDAKKHGYKVFLISSAIPGEGKSTISTNLALGLARKGKSVILVDFDLRSPMIDEYMNLERGPYGTIDCLQGTATINEAVVQYKNLPLAVIHGGKEQQDTMRILNSDSTREFIDQLRQMADYVILDTPPSAMLADASLVARHADAAIYVVRQDYAQVKDIMEGVGNLVEEEIPIVGCVLNYAEVGITGYGYGYGYGYGRGYGLYGRGYGSYGSYGGYGSEKDK